MVTPIYRFPGYYIFMVVAISFLLTQCAPGTYDQSINDYRQEMNDYFSDTATSPLTNEGLTAFHGLDFFPIDKKYRVEAEFMLTPEASPFLMQMTTDRIVEYRKYGEAQFELDGERYTLSLYRNQQFKEVPEYADHLFLPFKDYTNGVESYGGGRFLDLTIPEGNTIIIDFNKCYNPYCVYNHRYSCPIPPDENHLEVCIPVGVKKYDH
jgi:uncharacterized protein (DUF1684 family)